MNTFAKYLAESQRTFSYRIKMVGEVPQGFLSDLKSRLSQFDIVKMSDAKTTPVRAVNPDFPAFPNERMTFVDVEFKYPAIEPQIKQLAQILGFDPNRVVMNTPGYEDSQRDESERIADQNKNLLKDTDYPTPDKQQRDLKKDYSAESHDHVVLKNAYRSDFTVAGGRTPPAKTTNDLPQGQKSPMTTIKRPPKPATGAQPRG